MHTLSNHRRGRRPSRARRAAGAGGVSIALLVAMISAVPASAASAPAPAFGVSPPTAADAPWTKTVTYLVSKMTPAEEIAVIEKGTDPDNHGQAGYLAGVPRLGIPPVRHADALGINVRADATAFPTRLGLASSFDRDAYNQLGEQVGKEGIATDVDLIYGPQVDMARYPSWSRNLTTNGEDAYVSSQFASAEINGIQSQGLMSQVKHVSFYNGQAQSTPSLISSQAAHEVYLAPAQSAIQDGNVSSLMCSYATFEIVGEQDHPDYSCSNSNLLNNIVKNQFGLKGFITSDYTASKKTSDILAGMDNEFATSNLSVANLQPLIDTTSSSYDPAYAAATQNAVARMVYEDERFGLLDNSKIPAAYQSDVPQHGNVASTDNSTNVDKAAGSAVALSLAEKSGVLLKNSGNALPLSKTAKIAVVGPTATLMPASPGGERARGYGDRTNFTPLKAMQTAVGTGNIVSAPGVDWIGTTIPTASLQTTNDATATPGLTRTTTDVNNVVTTSTDAVLDGKQTNLLRGNKYSWTGYINVATDDTYQLLLQRPYGTDSGNPAAYNGGVTQASSGAVTLSVDGTIRTLANPGGNILQNDFPDSTVASNGQYLGKDNTGVALPLTAGLHQVTFTYNPVLTAATTPTVRFAWAPLNQNIAKAVTAAQTADETVIFVDDSSPGVAAGAGPNSSTTAALRNLNANQVTLIQTVGAAARAAGHKAVVVLNSGTAVAVAPWLSSVDAVLEMWYPGQEGGTATSNLLYGVVNPSGKLPMTFPIDDNNTPFTGHLERTTGSQDPGEATPTIKWSDGVDVGYRWYTDPAANTNDYQPLFAFGYGLSYSTFALSGLSAKNASDGGLDVTLTVKNTGAKDGATSPQIYLGASPDLAAPVYNADGLVTSGFQQSALKLVQFDHVELAAGASKTETLHVDNQQLSAWDTVAQKWVLGTGDRTVSLGAASDNLVESVTKNIPATVVAPAITTDLAPVTKVSVGGTVNLAATANGTPTPTVRWQNSTDSGTTWNDITGETAGTLSFVATAEDNGSQIRAVFDNDLGMQPTTATTLQVSRPALSAPAVTVTGGVKVGAVTYTKGTVGLKWTASTPAGSLGSYQVLDGATVIKTAPAGTTTAALAFSTGTHQLSVRAVAKDALVLGGSKTSAKSTVTIDKTGPVVKIVPPAKPTKAASWTKVAGTATDAGSGPATVAVSLTEKRGAAYYFYNGSTWTKVATQAIATAKAKKIRVAVTGGKWATTVHGIAAGTLRLTSSGVDRLGNASAAATVSLRLT